MIEAPRKGGVPEHPFGYENSPANQVDGDGIAALLTAGSWVGTDLFGARFIQHVSADGRVAFRSNLTQLAGTGETEGDLFCVGYPSSMLGRKDCGPIYRNPGEPGRGGDGYVGVSLGNIYRFSILPTSAQGLGP